MSKITWAIILIVLIFVGFLSWKLYNQNQENLVNQVVVPEAVPQQPVPAQIPDLQKPEIRNGKG